MPRTARVVVPGCAYHLTQRGNRRDRIFFSDKDRSRYLRHLSHYAAKYLMDIWAYCLMTNHVHLIVVARRPDSLARAIGNAHRHYSRYINKRNDWTGHLWANRFYSGLLADRQLWTAARYVETNPVRAGLVSRAVECPWSSAPAHDGKRHDPLLAPDRPFPGSIASWAVWLDSGSDDPSFDEIRRTSARCPARATELE